MILHSSATQKSEWDKEQETVRVTQQNNARLPIGLGHTLELVFFLSTKAVGI